MMAHMLDPMLRRCLLAVVVVAVACRPGLVGTDLGRGVAPDFTLTDGASGRSLTLSSLRGSVVVLSFLYTACPDTCPITASHFRAAQRALGNDAARVIFVAVSVDPQGDTPAAVQAFSAAHDLSQNWHYLIGQRASLAAVWSAYGIGSFPDPGKPTITHNDAIFLIDSTGHERVLLHSDNGSEALTADLKALLAGS